MNRRGRPPYPDILTPREWEVLSLMRQRLTNEEIASRLDVSFATAKFHVSEIINKLGVSDRREASAWQPDREVAQTRWWLAALAPLPWVKRLPFAWPQKAAAAAVLAATAAGIALLAWGVLSTSSTKGDTVPVDQSYWYGGFKVTIIDARLTAEDGNIPAGEQGASPYDRAVTFRATFENLGTADATPDSELALQWWTGAGTGGISFLPALDIPPVPAGRSSNGEFTFGVPGPGGFNFESATLIVGNDCWGQCEWGQHQVATALIPLGPRGQRLATLEPQTITMSSTVTAGAVTANVTGVELRADLPDQHREMEPDKLALTVFFDVDVGTGDFAPGMGVLQSTNVALILPDGTAVGVRDDEASGVNELLEGNEGTTISGLSARFEVDGHCPCLRDRAAAGTYMFVVRGNYGPGGSMVEGRVAFELRAWPVGSAGPSDNRGFGWWFGGHSHDTGLGVLAAAPCDGGTGTTSCNA